MEDAQFEILNYTYWLQTADRLKFAAETIKSALNDLFSELDETNKYFESRDQTIGLLQAYMLTMGFSLENLLKGYSLFIYEQNNAGDSLQSSKQLLEIWKVKSGHELLQIAKSSGLNLQETEIELLKRFEVFTRWAGRYHIPIREPEILSMLKGELELKSLAFDRQTIEQLFDRIRNLTKTA